MCGIVGYVGKKPKAIDFILTGLQALEYRGYDSAGLVTLESGSPRLLKQSGRVNQLQKEVLAQQLTESSLAIGHTRWATHGSPTVSNAHPHCDMNQEVFVVHNGIIENYQELRRFLESEGYVFQSDTDTEVIPMLIAYHLRTTKEFSEAFQQAILELKGAYAITALYTHEPDALYVACLSSPLIIGIGTQAHYIASDASAIQGKAQEVVYLADFEVARITANNLEITHLHEKTSIKRNSEAIEIDTEENSKHGFDHFMIKEIHDIPETIRSATRGRIQPDSTTVKLGGIEAVREQLKHIERIIIVACGTSYYAGLVGEYLIEEIAGIPVEVQLASEFKYREEPISRGSALLAISQSGETADTIAAIKKVAPFGVLTLGIVNVVGSTIARLTQAGVYCHAGPERSVASTKAFIAQVTILLELALHLSGDRSALHTELFEELLALPSKAEEAIKDKEKIKRLAKKYASSKNFLYVGRGNLYPAALEGALKLKEVSYIHAEGFAAGELKHGPLAMIDKELPTFALAGSGELEEKTLSNLEEIRARSGPIIAVGTKGNDTLRRLTKDIIELPESLPQTQPILAAIAMQLFAYYVALEKGLDIDQPRNLAKSVTVE